MNELVNTDLLKDIFHLEDFVKNEQLGDYDISYIKKGNMLTVAVKYHSLSEKLKDYVNDLDDDIYEDFCEQYEEWTGESLKDFNDRMEKDELDTSDLSTVSNLVKHIVLNKVEKYLNEYDLFPEFIELVK